MATTETRDGAQPGARRLGLTVPDGLTRGLAEEAANFLANMREADQVFEIVASANREDGRQGSVVLPQLAVDLLARLLTELGRGHAVVVEAVAAEITTQQAADILNVSRPYLVGLLEKGDIPYRKVGNRRKVPLIKLLEYQRRDDIYRREIARQLTQESQRIGLNY